MIKLFNAVNGIFYLLWGAWGAVYPHKSAALMGWDVTKIVGLHEKRATWLFFAMLGVFMLHRGLKDQGAQLTAQLIVFITAGLIMGRTLGLLMDGTDIQRTYILLGIEAAVVLLGLFLLKRTRA